MYTFMRKTQKKEKNDAARGPRAGAAKRGPNDDVLFSHGVCQFDPR